MKKIAFATGNRGKLREAQEILGEGYGLVTPAELGITEDIPETGNSIEANSLEKATYLHERASMDCFADDTGLEVEALGGAPGVYTARFASLVAEREGDHEKAERVGHDFNANMDALLSELEGCENRRCRFRTVVTLIVEGQTKQFEGVLDGRIALKKSGNGGFGYDPIFIADEYPDRSLAELGESVKNEISHRGKALRAMSEWLKECE